MRDRNGVPQAMSFGQRCDLLQGKQPEKAGNSYPIPPDNNKKQIEAHKDMKATKDVSFKFNVEKIKTRK